MRKRHRQSAGAGKKQALHSRGASIRWNIYTAAAGSPKQARSPGTLLGIRPVLTVQDGALCVLGKARGARQSNNFLNEAIAKRGGIDFTMPLMLGYSGSSDEALREYIAASREIWEGKLDTLPVTSIGSTIGTHVGPGAIVVAFFAKET